MSDSTMKILSSIRSLIDEWSIRKEGGKQSFFILKEIDKLLADTPIDDVVSSKDVADKKKEVTMLRLERDEMLIRRQLDRVTKETLRLDYTVASQRIINKNLRRINTDQHKTIDGLEADLKASHTNNAALGKTLEEANTTLYNAKNVVEGLESDIRIKDRGISQRGEMIDALEADLSNRKSAMVMKNGVINDRVEHLERVYNQLHGFQDDMYEKNKTIDELNETISDLRMAASDMLDTINECSRSEAEDSKVLMQVVEAVKIWEEYQYTQSISQIANIVEDYLDVPESPVVTLKTPSMCTRVVSKNEETHLIDENKMEAVRMLVDSDMWVLHTDEEAVEDKQQKETIDELKALNKALRIDVDDRDRHIEKLAHELADEKMTLAAYRNNPLSDQVADRDKRIEQLIVLNEALRVDMELAHNLSCDHIAGQDRFIEELKNRIGKFRDEVSMLPENFWVVVGQLRDTNRRQTITIDGLKTELDARNQVIKDFKAIEQKETVRLHTVIEGNGKIIDELNDMYCDACGKLERIEKIAEHPAYDCFSTALDEIIKIIQEE